MRGLGRYYSGRGDAGKLRGGIYLGHCQAPNISLGLGLCIGLVDSRLRLQPQCFYRPRLFLVHVARHLRRNRTSTQRGRRRQLLSPVLPYDAVPPGLAVAQIRLLGAHHRLPHHPPPPPPDTRLRLRLRSQPGQHSSSVSHGPALLVSSWSQFCIFFFLVLRLFRPDHGHGSMTALAPPSFPCDASPKTRCCSREGHSVDDGSTHVGQDEQGTSGSTTALALGFWRLCIDAIDSLKISENIENIGETLRAPGYAARSLQCANVSRPPAGCAPEAEAARVSRPFHKWLRSFHRRARQRPPLCTSEAVPRPPWLINPEYDQHLSPQASVNQESSSSGSSYRFVSAVRSASVSLASISIVARSGRNNARSQCVSRTNCSSVASASGPRVSEDSTMLDKTDVVDAAATELAMQRRRILEELISTEEDYIGDVRFLMNVCRTAYCFDRDVDAIPGLRHHSCLASRSVHGSEGLHQQESD